MSRTNGACDLSRFGDRRTMSRAGILVAVNDPANVQVLVGLWEQRVDIGLKQRRGKPDRKAFAPVTIFFSLRPMIAMATEARQIEFEWP